MSSIGQYRESEVSCTLVLMLLLLLAVELGVTGVEAEPGASLHSRKRLALSLSLTGARVEAWCLLIHVDASPPLVQRAPHD